MISALKKIPFLVRTARTIRGWFGLTEAELTARYHHRRQTRAIADYLGKHGLKKLQIGAQSNSIDGWLNVDLLPKTDEVVYMDATKTFPFEDQSIDYIFTEHMIEHVSFSEADYMISECARVLKSGGKIRIATPNILTVSEIISRPHEENYNTYIDYYMDRFFPEDMPKLPVFVANKLFYSFGHKFIHSVDSLRYLVEKHGLVFSGECEVQESNDSNLKNLEQHWREMGELANQVETLIIEAERV